MKTDVKHPTIIQGGMGIAVSSWQLAQQVAIAGELGVISGTAIDSVVARRLQDGDLSGDIRRAMSHFPNQKTISEIMDRFYSKKTINGKFLLMVEEMKQELMP